MPVAHDRRHRRRGIVSVATDPTALTAAPRDDPAEVNRRAGVAEAENLATTTTTNDLATLPAVDEAPRARERFRGRQRIVEAGPAGRLLRDIVRFGDGLLDDDDTLNFAAALVLALKSECAAVASLRDRGIPEDEVEGELRDALDRLELETMMENV
jgi:hypothetical protein